MIFTKILSTTVFNTDNKKLMFLKHHISISDWFMKDHVTLETKEHGCWKFSFTTTGINYILKCIKIEYKCIVPSMFLS